jgi:hypothetical protein
MATENNGFNDDGDDDMVDAYSVATDLPNSNPQQQQAASTEQHQHYQQQQQPSIIPPPFIPNPSPQQSQPLQSLSYDKACHYAHLLTLTVVYIAENGKGDSKEMEAFYREVPHHTPTAVFNGIQSSPLLKF